MSGEEKRDIYIYIYLALAYIIINLSVYEFINFRYMNVTLNSGVFQQWASAHSGEVSHVIAISNDSH